MRAVTYHGPNKVQLDNVADPGLIAADHIVLRVTATAICGSDLHLYRGKAPGLTPGDILGYKFMGIVEAAGREVTKVKVGDRLVTRLTIACGDCFFAAVMNTPLAKIPTPDAAQF